MQDTNQRILIAVATVALVFATTANAELPTLPTLPTLPQLPNSGNTLGTLEEDVPQAPTTTRPEVPNVMPDRVYTGLDGCIHARIGGLDYTVRCTP